MPKTKAEPQYPTAAAFMPTRLSLTALEKAAAGCRGCPLYIDATQTVFGEGPAGAEIIIVGEVPGDQEDVQGRPFVGPAGRLMHAVLAEVGLDRKKIYFTNAVKHFKFELRGKKRLHAKPRPREIDACRPWLMAELETIKPKLIICMGATAAQALLGRAFRVTKDRGKFFEQSDGTLIMATIHPSAVLRMPDDDARRQARIDFAADLKSAMKHLRGHAK